MGLCSISPLYSSNRIVFVSLNADRLPSPDNQSCCHFILSVCKSFCCKHDDQSCVYIQVDPFWVLGLKATCWVLNPNFVDLHNDVEWKAPLCCSCVVSKISEWGVTSFAVFMQSWSQEFRHHGQDPRSMLAFWLTHRQKAAIVAWQTQPLQSILGCMISMIPASATSHPPTIDGVKTMKIFIFNFSRSLWPLTFRWKAIIHATISAALARKRLLCASCTSRFYSFDQRHRTQNKAKPSPPCNCSLQSNHFWVCFPFQRPEVISIITVQPVAPDQSEAEAIGQLVISFASLASSGPKQRWLMFFPTRWWGVRAVFDLASVADLNSCRGPAHDTSLILVLVFHHITDRSYSWVNSQHHTPRCCYWCCVVQSMRMFLH